MALDVFIMVQDESFADSKDEDEDEDLVRCRCGYLGRVDLLEP